MLNRKLKTVELLIAVTPLLNKTKVALFFEAVVGKSEHVSTVNSSNTNAFPKESFIFRHLPSKYNWNSPNTM